MMIQATQNALLPIIVASDVHDKLSQMVAENPFLKLRVDLAAQRLMLPSGQGIKFPVDPFAKHRLPEGIDELAYFGTGYEIPKLRERPGDIPGYFHANHYFNHPRRRVSRLHCLR